MEQEQVEWSAAPLIWGDGECRLEIFIEPTCPFSARAFGKLDALLLRAKPEGIQVSLWLHSQPWHLFSGIICRAILAASTMADGRETAKSVIEAVFAHREDFEFDDHRRGNNLDTTPRELIARVERVSGIPIFERFQISGLEKVLKEHTKYARSNGIHVSPTFIVNGQVQDVIQSGDSVEQWIEKIQTIRA